MYRKRVLVALFILLAITLTLLTSCTTEKVDRKAELEEAIQKQIEIQTFDFQGIASIQLDAALFNDGAGENLDMLIQMISSADYTWKGTSDHRSVRLESDISIKPTRMGGAQFTIPLLIHDSHLYFSIPLINKEEEYMDIDLSSEFEQRAQQSESIFLQMLSDLSAQLDNESITEQKPAVEDGRKHYRIAMNDTNFPLLLQSLTNTLSSFGVSFATDATKWQVGADSYLDVVVNEAGYMNNLAADITFTANDTDEQQAIQFDYHISAMNEDPAFHKSIPTETKTLEDIYTFIK